MSELMPAQKDQPIKTLLLCSCDQLTVFRSGKSKLHHLVGPVLEYRGAKRALIHVRPEMIAPTWGKLVKLVVGCRCVAIIVALKIREADVHDHVNSFELG